MSDHAPQWRRPYHTFLVMMIPAMALAGFLSAAGHAADPPDELTAEQREQLEKQAAELFHAGFQAFRRADLATAVESAKRSLEIREKLYPKDRYPEGHAELAKSLNAMGFLLQAQGSCGEARVYYERALAMRESHYPKDSHPHGHPDLAQSLNNLGSLLEAQGSHGEARGYFDRALAMRESLYPKDRYPQGHPHLATSLHNLGYLLQAQGAYGEARGYFERALAMYESHYPKDRYPRGHPDLARELNSLGKLLQAQGAYGEARGYFERGLAMYQSLYPKDRYPRGHSDLATSLNNLGGLLRDQGSFVEARGYLERALTMRESLYPKDRYPQGDPELAASLNNMGTLLDTQGSYGEARGYYERALAMYQSLYTKDRYPQGHPELAVCLNNLGGLLQAHGSYGQARRYFERALAMDESLYTKDRYAQGHPHLASSLNNLGLLLQAQGSYGQARGYLERALAAYQSLYPKDRYPQGHPELAICLNNLAALLQAQGSYGEAREYFERALATHESLYSIDRYPQGHPDVAMSLSNMAGLLHAEGSYDEAVAFLRQGTDMQQALSEILLPAASEAEAMSFLAQLPLTQDGLISVSIRVPGSDEETYRRVWNGKSALTRILHERQSAMLGRAATDSAIRRIVTAWRDARSRLARLILATADGRDHSERAAMIKEFGSEKERLERELAAAVPEFGRGKAMQQSRYDDLLRILPERTAVLDLLRFTRFEQDAQVKGKKGERLTPSYVGFVLSKGQPVRMVDLGPAQPIDGAVSGWRHAILRAQDSLAPADLRKLVWKPLARHLPKETTTVYLAPDRALSYIPWAALPGDQPGTVLLEQYALAIVPHAPFLLDRLTAPKSTGHASTAGLLLAVGGVAYSIEPKPVTDEQSRLQLLAARPAETKRGGDGWADLPGTLQELDAVSRLGAKHEILRLHGADAGTARLLRELPRARWAHIATHGFFADPSIRSVLTPDPKLFTQIGRERIGAGLRNPLVLSGLVLAGANVSGGRDDPLAHDDRGILTAEAIAGLDLSSLELAVLSACETGLGLVGGGEGIFGLQRAFHMAGAQNVVASLWKVDDQATAALMAIFYDRLWQQGKPPLEALREAHLALYRQPELIGKLAAARGTPDFDKLVQRPEPSPETGKEQGEKRAPVRQWAAFVLSGDGR